ncbi:MAG: hypothetical protein JJ896_15475 [Rhodothermales bacterium]|nr:hypothetical protein [Rhodothermales bacterium]MBO6781055.1 hypothetical protein [Rhodothermales bacterium]
MAHAKYDLRVFVNCPFDDAYTEMFEALIFTVTACGLVVVSSKAVLNGAEDRMSKLKDLIGSCRYGIHDISRTDLDLDTGLPRFNMPLELGMFLGARSFGGKRQKQKSCAILDVSEYRYRDFISDLAGYEVMAHGNRVDQLIRQVRNWIRALPDPDRTRVRGWEVISKLYTQFREDLPVICRNLGLEPDTLGFHDFVAILVDWLRDPPDPPPAENDR